MRKIMKTVENYLKNYEIIMLPRIVKFTILSEFSSHIFYHKC